jgi:hypothetical protein
MPYTVLTREELPGVTQGLAGIDGDIARVGDLLRGGDFPLQSTIVVGPRHNV